MSSNNIHTLSDKSISQSKGRETKRGLQDTIVTFDDLEGMRRKSQLSKAERKEKKGDIILNVVQDGTRYFLHPYPNLSGLTVFLNPEDHSKGLYEKNGKFYYGKTGGDTGNELKTFTKEEIEGLKIKRIKGEKNFYERIKKTKLDKYFDKFKTKGYIVGSDLPTFVIKEPMDSVREKNNHINVKKKNNHINSTSTLTDESKSTGIDSNLEKSGYSFTNQVDANSYYSNNSYKEFLEGYEQPENKRYFDENNQECYSFSSKPDEQHNSNQKYAEVKVISNNNYGKNSGYSSYGYDPNAIYTEYYDYTPQYINSYTQYNTQAYNQAYYPYNWYFNK